MKKGRELTKQIIEETKKTIAEYDTAITVRQLYYRLVSAHTIPNTINSYKNFDRILSKIRKMGLIQDGQIVDNSKPATFPNVFEDLPDFLITASQSYKRNHWQTQSNHIEVWCEKDALSGILQPICSEYQVPLVVGRGYQSLTNKKKAAERFKEFHANGKSNTILYLGDFDPSGLDIVRDLKENLSALGTNPQIKQVALTLEQIKKHKLPPILTKESDPRTANYITKYGDIAVELDALPPTELRKLISSAIAKFIDGKSWDKSKETEQTEQIKLNQLISQFDGAKK